MQNTKEKQLNQTKKPSLKLITTTQSYVKSFYNETLIVYAQILLDTVIGPSNYSNLF